MVKEIWNYSIPWFGGDDLHSLLCSAPEKAKWDFESLLPHHVPPGFRLSPSLTSPAITCWSSHHAVSAAEFHFSDVFSCEILLALSLPSLMLSFYLCPSLALLSLSACPAVSFQSNLSENQANFKKPLFLCVFLAGCLNFCPEMAQPQENASDIGALFYVCARSDGDCSPLRREELRQLIEQEFADAMEVRTRPRSWCRRRLRATGLESVQPRGPVRVYRTPGSLGKAQMPSNPRICREEKLVVLPVPAACRAQCGERPMGLDFCPETARVLPERWHKGLMGFADTVCLFTEPAGPQNRQEVAAFPG